VEISRDELTARFDELPDEELSARLRSGALTPLAAAVAGMVLRSRGITVPAGTEAADFPADSVDGGADASADLVTVAQFWNPLQANLLRAYLESHGIFVFVWGEHLGTANVILAAATGGIRVQVRSTQLAHAKEVMRAYERGDLAIPESPDTELSRDAATSEAMPGPSSNHSSGRKWPGKVLVALIGVLLAFLLLAGLGLLS
jgi:hypothetical protein